MVNLGSRFFFPPSISKILILVLVVFFLKKNQETSFNLVFEFFFKSRTWFWFQFQFQKSNPISIWFLQAKTTNDGSHLSNYPTPI
jgi:hypothetical protein